MSLKPLLLLALLIASFQAQSRPTSNQAIEALDRAIRSFHRTNVEGGYAYYVTPDLEHRWGEGILLSNEIEVQPPGTPAVGQAFLRVHRTTGSEIALTAATDAAHALARGQTPLGGWNHTIRFDEKPRASVSFDDDQTQSATRFLIALDAEIDDPAIDSAIEKAIAMMIATQLENGGWPHQYPEQGNYHDFATFNDQGINDCIQVMIEADRQYGDPAIRASLEKAALFLMRSQLPPPQPGWAQQYNAYLQPAWARAFEPPSVCPLVTVNNIQTLIDLHLRLGDPTLPLAIPDAIRWLDSIRLENGLWARFVEIHTNQPLYYDRGRIRVNSIEELSLERRSGYGYEVNLKGRLESARDRFAALSRLGGTALAEVEGKRLYSPSERASLGEESEAILGQLDENSLWITRGDRFKKRVPGELWQGEYEVTDRISSRVFIDNVTTLCDYLDALAALNR